MQELWLQGFKFFDFAVFVSAMGLLLLRIGMVFLRRLQYEWLYLAHSYFNLNKVMVVKMILFFFYFTLCVFYF